MDYGLTDFLTLLGSLGLFLYGMKVMSEALMELAGDRMRNILATTTSNRFYALLTGFLITAAIQSSSATTLMVVSFVNAGLLTLGESVGVIMGANIGTTVTAWAITILGFKVKMSAIALPLVGLGFFLSMSKKGKRAQWGHFIVGFALLFIGLDFLQDSVPDLGNQHDSLAFLADYTSRGYLSLLLFLLIGAVLTLVVQSSSATMALTLLMCYEGWLPFDMAAAMVVGQNLGTTITANLAAIVANYHAKRAARAHLIFNLLGVCWILLVFYPFIQWVGQVAEGLEGQSPFVSAAAIPLALSLFHTSFNVLNALLLIGFMGFIVHLVERMVPPFIEVKMAIEEPLYLTETSLEYPETAIKALTDESVRLLQNAAYKVLVHGLGVHRTDLESEKHLRDILTQPHGTQIDIDREYHTKIKTIYSRILEYATELQAKFSLEEKDLEQIRNILIADRLLVQVVKRMKPLHANIERYLEADNEAIRHEYNTLRRNILKVVRAIKKIGLEGISQEDLETLHHRRSKAKQMDVLLSGRVSELLRDKAISREMASSLINDSSNASRIAKNLVDIATMLYKPQDKTVNAIDEQNAREFIDSDTQAVEPVSAAPLEGIDEPKP